MSYFEDANIIERLKKNKIFREEQKKRFETAEKNISKIIKRSTLIKYPTYKESYDYVDSLFKRSNIKEVEIHIVSPSILEKYGFDGGYGFFYIPKKMVFIRSSVDKHTIDEIIVHELIHYAFNKENIVFSDVEMEEEGAYGWSIGYLREKGYSDEYIINNFLKEYYSVIMKNKSILKFISMNNKFKNEYIKSNDKKRIDMLNKNRKKIEKINEKMALEKSEILMSIYNEKLKNGTPFSLYESNSIYERKSSRFDFLDLE